MLTLPNLLSFLRIPLAFLFLQENVFLRFFAIILAMISDGLDGFLARRYQTSSKFGTLFDPFADKFFVVFVLSIFIRENRLTIWEAAAFICRDFSVFFFGIYLALKGKLSNYRFRAIWCGKITTFFQFMILLALTFKFDIPFFIYTFFIVLGMLALMELYLPEETKSEKN